jgi:hypothetical protein
MASDFVRAATATLLAVKLASAQFGAIAPSRDPIHNGDRCSWRAFANPISFYEDRIIGAWKNRDHTPKQWRMRLEFVRF